MSTPHDDLQQLYEDASAMQGEQPSPTVRTAVLAHAAMLAQSHAKKAAEVSTARSAANWPHWKSGLVASVLLVPLLGMLMLHMKDTPEWQEPLPASPRAEVAVAAKPAADASVAPAPAMRNASSAVESEARKTQKIAPAAREAAPAVAPKAAPVIAPASPPTVPPAPAPLPAATVLSYAPAPPAIVADAAPARSAVQGHVGTVAEAAQRADNAVAGQNRTREIAPLTSRFTSAPMAAPAPAPAKTVILAPGASRPDAYLLMAAQKGDMAMVLAQLNAGASLRAHDSQGRTALMWAALGGHTEVIQLLLVRGADRTATDNQGWTALQHAQQAGQKDAAALLE